VASSRRLVWWLACGLVSVTVGCARTSLRPFSPEGPRWVDPDQRPFDEEPAEYFSPFGWDAADQTIFRPLTRVFAVAPGGEAVNVNALDEVPDSSWFRNRIGRFPMTPDELALGPCRERPIDPGGTWTVTGAKPNGANPGFIIKDQYGRRFLLKFDGVVQGPRATSADVLVSKLYYAAGYYTPCNEIVFFDRGILRIDPEAEGENDAGKQEPLTNAHLDVVFQKAIRLPDGRYRASASLFIEGKPIGPWRYQGRRRDDPNDVVRHEDRRELRGARVLAAWTNHFDSREQNTMAAWMDTGQAGGYVRHYYMDFGDCLGSIWEPPMLGRRIGHSSYFDPGYVAADFATLGVITRPWDEARFGPSGPVFGYYDIERFDPARYHPGYPNPAFTRMTERDAAWMARIVSQFSDDHLRAAVQTARIQDAFLRAELFRLLRGRRDVVLQRYLTALSPLAHPTVQLAPGTGRSELCLRDLAVEAGVSSIAERVYGARAWSGTGGQSVGNLGRLTVRGALGACVQLPTEFAEDRYLIVDVHAGDDSQSLLAPARVHLYHGGTGGYRVVGLERPSSSRSPG
jgi:hypothetical protein